MKKYILLSLSAFILACLIVGGIVWRLETKGKIKFKSDNQALTLDHLIRELIPDSGQIYGKWEVLARQEDPVEWEYENSQGAKIYPRIGTVKLVRNDNKPIPGHWDILLKGKGMDPCGYKLFGISHDSIFDIDPKVLPVKLQKGELAELLPLKKGQQLPFVNKKAHYELYSVQLKGKAPAQLLIEWPGENNGHTFSIYGETSASEKLWDFNDDVFDYPSFCPQIQQPLFPRGIFFMWWLENGNSKPLPVDLIIEKNGRATSEEKGVLQILKKMPQWKPGKIKGKPIRTQYDLLVDLKS